jgi:DNA polymerase elongation subunit (family B)
MLERIDLKKLLVIDIETVPQYAGYNELPQAWKELWAKKMQRELKEGLTADGLYQRAGIYAEFGKIICICAGFFYEEGNTLSFKVKAFYGDDEKQLLSGFNELLNKSYNTPEHVLCGHNSREFDFPYIARRCLVNDLPIPPVLDNAGKKPWEVQHIDTLDLWKFGDYKSFSSLDLLAAVFGIESPKGDMDGSMVWSAYWIDKNIERIKTYCMKDVVTVAQLLLKFKGMDLLKKENVSFIN